MNNINETLKELKVQEKELTEAWNKEKNLNEDIKKKKRELERLKFDLDQAENELDYNKAAVLRHGEIPKVEKELEELNKVEKIKFLVILLLKMILLE